jgi:ABC-type nitrate/sulfonate/bicarbonate transport system substrate-binding protein
MLKLTRNLFLILAVVAFGGPNADAQQKTEVRMATLAPSSLLWLHAIAKDKGFYAEQNIEVKELVAGSSPALLQAVSSGSAEAGVSLGDVVIRAIDKGAPVIISGAILDHTPMRLIGGKGITSMKELAGVPVTAGAVEGGTANLLRFQLQGGGVDPSTLKMLALTNSRDRVVALGNGQVKGALLIAPFDTLAIREGMKVLDVYREPYLQTPLILNKEWAEKNRAAAVGITQAMKKAAVWIHQPANKQEAIDILSKFTKVPADVCADGYKFLVEEQKAISSNLEVPAASLENIIKINAALTGEKDTKPFDLKRYYDASYLAAK